MASTVNFGFMGGYGQNLEALPALAEGYFRTDPSTTLIKLRQFAELLAKEIAARQGLTNQNVARASLLFSQTCLQYNCINVSYFLNYWLFVSRYRYRNKRRQ